MLKTRFNLMLYLVVSFLYSFPYIIEEEREESMETDTPLDSATPAPPEKKAILEDLKAEVNETAAVKHQRKVPIRTCPMTPTLMRTSFWGCQPIFPFPGDTLMTLSPLLFPQEMMTYKCVICNSNS